MIAPEGDLAVRSLEERFDVAVVEQEDHALARQVERECISILRDSWPQ